VRQSSQCKRSRHAAFADFLGVVINFSSVTSTGCVIIKPKTEHCAHILSELDNCAEALQLSPSLAQKMFGKVSFLRTSLFGRASCTPARLLIQGTNLFSDKDSFAAPADGLLPPWRQIWTDDLEDMRSFYKTPRFLSG